MCMITAAKQKLWRFCWKIRLRTYQVTLYYTVFENRDAITRYAVIHNASGARVELERALSMCLDCRWGDYDLISFYGRHVFERAFERTPEYVMAKL